MFTEGRRILREYDGKILASGDYSMSSEANTLICRKAKEKTTEVLNQIVCKASENMKNGYNRSDS